MKTVIGLLVLFLGSVSVAGGAACCLERQSIVQNCNASEKVVTKWKTVYSTKAQDQKIRELEAEVKRLQTAVVSIRPVVVTKTKVETQTVVLEKNNEYRNSLSLLAGASATDLDSETRRNRFRAETDYEPDFGLMFQRDLTSRIRGSIGVTIQGSGYLGLGLNF